MKLKFIYTVDSELKIVEEKIRARDFLLKNNYEVGMPKGYTLNSKDFSKVREQIEKEYDEEKMEGARKYISNKWHKYEIELDNFLGKIPYKVPNTLLITLSQYGGGSYWVPNRIDVNVNHKNLFSGIFHELIHLIIEEPVIEKFKISHWDKESLVDYFFVNDKNLKKVFPDYECEGEPASKELLKKVGWI